MTEGDPGRSRPTGEWRVGMGGGGGGGIRVGVGVGRRVRVVVGEGSKCRGMGVRKSGNLFGEEIKKDKAKVRGR